MSASAKIGSLEELAEITASCRAAGKTVVHCHGTFDVLHVGAIRILEQGKRLGDTLVVTVQADPPAEQNGSRPTFCQELRAETLAALSVVDYVAVSKPLQPAEAIRLLQPNIYFLYNEGENPQTMRPGGEIWKTRL